MKKIFWHSSFASSVFFCLSMNTSLQKLPLKVVLKAVIDADLGIQGQRLEVDRLNSVLTGKKWAYTPSFSISQDYTKNVVNSSSSQAEFSTVNPTISSQFNAKQNLFQGLTTQYDIDVASNQLEMGKATLEQNIQDLVKTTIDTVFQILTLRSDLKYYKEEINYLHTKKNEVGKNVSLGQDSLINLNSVESSIASTELNVITTQNQIDLLYKTLELSYNFDFKSLDLEQASLPQTILQIEKNKSPERPEIRVKHFDAEAAQAQVNSSYSLFMPSLDLGADYLIHTNDDTMAKRKWGFTLSFSMPLNYGFNTTAQVFQARLNAAEKRLATQNTELQIKLDQETAKLNISAKAKEAQGLKKLVQVSRKDLELKEKGAKNGTIPFKDVLDALSVYQDAQRNENKANLSISQLKLINLNSQGFHLEELL